MPECQGTLCQVSILAKWLSVCLLSACGFKSCTKVEQNKQNVSRS